MKKYANPRTLHESAQFKDFKYVNHPMIFFIWGHVWIYKAFYLFLLDISMNTELRLSILKMNKVKSFY